MAEEKKRVFFALQAVAPWSSDEPEGRVLLPAERHMTLSFLGNTAWRAIQQLLARLPAAPFTVAPIGLCDACLFLPNPSHPKLVCWHIAAPEMERIKQWQKILCKILFSLRIAIEQRHSFMPHVTLCRAPCDFTAWKSSFQQLPLYFPALHLYQSMGALRYTPLWSQQLLLPFEQIDHTADMAFIVRGETLESIAQNALIALAFQLPEILTHSVPFQRMNSLEDVIFFLNEAITKTDIAIGTPFKAVSQHGYLEKKTAQNKKNFWQWEMIIDV